VSSQVISAIPLYTDEQVRKVSQAEAILRAVVSETIDTGLFTYFVKAPLQIGDCAFVDMRPKA
jgi:hypothetical protein